ncbi:hypothetical protein TNCV_1170351, partial [Trichonephila clavipes]
ETNSTQQQERTTQLGSRNETTQLVSRNETTQLNKRKQLNSSVGTKQLNSSVGTKQLNSALPSTACNRLQPPATAYNRLQPPTTAYNRLQPPTTACTAFTAESAFSTYSRCPRKGRLHIARVIVTSVILRKIWLTLLTSLKLHFNYESTVLFCFLMSYV